MDCPSMERLLLGYPIRLSLSSEYPFRGNLVLDYPFSLRTSLLLYYTFRASLRSIGYLSVSMDWCNRERAIYTHLQTLWNPLKQCCGSMPDSDPDPDADPNPSIFIFDLQDANKKISLWKSFSAFYFLKVLLHHCSKLRSQKEVTKQQKSKFFLLFLLNDRRIRIRIHKTD